MAGNPRFVMPDRRRNGAFICRPHPRLRYPRGVPDRHSRSLQGAVRRARWLAEIAAALDEAARLAGQFGPDARGSEFNALNERIGRLRGEIDDLRRGRPDDSPR